MLEVGERITMPSSTKRDIQAQIRAILVVMVPFKIYFYYCTGGSKSYLNEIA